MTAVRGARADVGRRPSAQPRTTAPKGRPTPKRSQTGKRRGPVAPAPMTSAEARKRRKEMRRTLTKDERRTEKVQRRGCDVRTAARR